MIAYRHCDGVELDGMKKIGAFFMVLSWQGKIPLLVLLLLESMAKGEHSFS